MDGWKEAGSSALVFSCRRFIASSGIRTAFGKKKGQAHSLTSYIVSAAHKKQEGFLHGNILYLSFIFFKQWLMFCGAATYSTKRKVCQKKKKLSHRFLDFSSSPPLKAERILCKKKVVVVVERDTRRREKTIILYRPWVIESETRLTKRHPFSRRVSLSPEQKKAPNVVSNIASSRPVSSATF